VDKTVAVIIFKFRDCEINLVAVLELLIRVDGLQEMLGECTDDGLLVVRDDVLEFEVFEVEAAVVVRIEAIGDVQNDSVLLRLGTREQEFLNQSVG
jgi:hypothetical protein